MTEEITQPSQQQPDADSVEPQSEEIETEEPSSDESASAGALEALRKERQDRKALEKKLKALERKNAARGRTAEELEAERDQEINDLIAENKRLNLENQRGRVLDDVIKRKLGQAFEIDRAAVERALSKMNIEPDDLEDEVVQLVMDMRRQKSDSTGRKPKGNPVSTGESGSHGIDLSDVSKLKAEQWAHLFANDPDAYKEAMGRLRAQSGAPALGHRASSARK